MRLKIEEDARRNYPNECCGVLLGHLSKLEVLDICALDNSFEGAQASAHFKISPMDIYHVEREIEGGDLHRIFVEKMREWGGFIRIPMDIMEVVSKHGSKVIALN